MDAGLEALKEYGEPDSWSSHQIVTFFPLADDTPDNNEQPQDYYRCDLHWLLNGKLYFVSILSSHWLHTFAFGGVMFDVTNAEGIHGGAFNARVDVYPLYRRTVDEVLNKIQDWVNANPEKFADIYNQPETPDSHRKFARIIDKLNI